MKALSLRQPWAHAVLYGGKRIENRLAWKNSSFRGPFVIHAAKWMTRAEYDDARAFTGTMCTYPDPTKLVFGALVGRAYVVDVIHSGGVIDSGGIAHGYRLHPLHDDPWYMGGFALVLDDVKAFETPIPFKGALGFFEVPNDVVAMATMDKAAHAIDTAPGEL